MSKDFIEIRGNIIRKMDIVMIQKRGTFVHCIRVYLDSTKINSDKREVDIDFNNENERDEYFMALSKILVGDSIRIKN